jgi:hypothetical protein
MACQKDGHTMTQTPRSIEYLMFAALLLNARDISLDPFSGSGTAVIAASAPAVSDTALNSTRTMSTRLFAAVERSRGTAPIYSRANIISTTLRSGAHEQRN